MIGIFAVDGGNATGLAWGIFDDEAKSVEAAIDGRLCAGSATINHKLRRGTQWHYQNTLKDVIEEKPLSDAEQIEVIFNCFIRFKRECVVDHLMSPMEVELVIEDFILMPGSHSGGKDGVASVRIAWGLAGYQMGVTREFARRNRQFHLSDPIWQQPSLMSYANDERLERWGLWVPGRDHERAAWRHVCARLNKLIR